MNIIPTISYWILLITLQFGGITEGDLGNTQIYQYFDYQNTSQEEIIITFTDKPAPDYWSVEAEVTKYYGENADEGSEYLGSFFISGYEDEEILYVFSASDEAGNSLFSVNEAGAPFELEKKDFSLNYLQNLQAGQDKMKIGPRSSDTLYVSNSIHRGGMRSQIFDLSYGDVRDVEVILELAVPPEDEMTEIDEIKIQSMNDIERTYVSSNLSLRD
jgi:hypothetical protein